MPEHPDWLKVGHPVRVTRYGNMRRVDHSWIDVVERLTPKSAIVDQERYVRKGDRYVLTPAYLKYTTELSPASEESPK